jgi:tetratricopeptide (TPR) repeat protein
MEALRKAILRAAAPVSVIGAIGGFVGDIIAPLGNFAPWVAGLSLLFALVLLMGFLSLRRKQGALAWDSPVAGGLIVASASTAIFGMWSVIFAVGPDRGYLAENVVPIATVQAQLLNLQEDVSEIKETTGQTATQVAVSATAQAQGFADIQSAFAALQSGQGTLVSNPTTPQEWYSNARLYELRGDTVNAIASYEGYLAFDLEYVDPFQRYVALLKATEGIARTRQIMTDRLNARPDSLTLELIAAQLLDARDERLARLEALAARAAQYGPVFHALGEAYTAAIGATATKDLLGKQSEAYTTLLKLEDEQQLFTRYYIDKALAEEQLENARKALAAFAGAQSALSNIDVQVTQYYNGTQFVIILPEISTIQRLLFSIDDPQPKTDVGRSAAGFVNNLITPFLIPVGDHTFYMQYVDSNSVTSEVISKPFRVDPVTVIFQQLPPDFSTNTIPGRFTVGILGADLAQAVSYTYQYSVDNDSLSESLAGFAIGTIDVADLKVGEHVLYIQATAGDGTQTPAVQFPFTVK